MFRCCYAFRVLLLCQQKESVVLTIDYVLLCLRCLPIRVCVFTAFYDFDVLFYIVVDDL